MHVKSMSAEECRNFFEREESIVFYSDNLDRAYMKVSDCLEAGLSTGQDVLQYIFQDIRDAGGYDFLAINGMTEEEALKFLYSNEQVALSNFKGEIQIFNCWAFDPTRDWETMSERRYRAQRWIF